MKRVALIPLVLVLGACGADEFSYGGGPILKKPTTSTTKPLAAFMSEPQPVASAGPSGDPVADHQQPSLVPTRSPLPLLVSREQAQSIADAYFARITLSGGIVRLGLTSRAAMSVDCPDYIGGYTTQEPNDPLWIVEGRGEFYFSGVGTFTHVLIVIDGNTGALGGTTATNM